MPCTGAVAERRRLIHGQIVKYILPPMSFWYVYVLFSAKDHQFYTGTTNNIKRRLEQTTCGSNLS